ncbi:MAG: replicative DNA helicase, partial [Kiritimatiellaeota bacterium]|nr:replicative DNA helicase [Kiritimatiellota bacterium]
LRNEEAVSAAAALRIPPHSMEAELGVIGSILLDAARVVDMCLVGQLTERSFWHTPHSIIFDACLQMQKQNLPIDLLSAVEFLRTNGRLEEVSGSVTLERILDSTPTAAHAKYYIDVVRQKHLLRSIIETSTTAQERCYTEEGNANFILSQTEQDILSISNQQQTEALSWPQAIAETVKRIDKVMSHGAESLGGISTGFRNLDRVMYGLRPAEMIVLAARPSMGKTSLAMNICENVMLGVRNAEGAQPVAVFSCEMSQEALVLRMLCARARVASQEVNRGFINPREDFQKLTRAASDLMKAPIYVDDTGGLDVMELRARARRMKKRYGIKLIMIDYLQLLHSRDYAVQGRQLETSNISANLKAMAKELQLPVLVLSQLSRSPENRDKSGKPKLSDLRDSGAIEQDADVVLLLRRPCKYEGSEHSDDKTLAIVDIAKHRNGPTGEAEMTFIDEFTTFEDRLKLTAKDSDNARLVSSLE